MQPFTKKLFKISGLIALLLVLLPIVGLFGYLGFLKIKVVKTDAISGLRYRVPLHDLFNKNFELVVEKRSKLDIPVPGYSSEHLDEIKERGLSNMYVSEVRTTKNGFLYVFMDEERCYVGHVSSLDPRANEGKPLRDCSNTWGSDQQTYFVFVGNEVFSFTTPFPSQIVYHDPHFTALPERIGFQDFKALIESLRY